MGQRWRFLGVGALLLSLQALGWLVPQGAAQEPAISGTITLDPSAKDKLPKEPLLLIVASKSPDPKKPPIIVKRIPGATFPHEYTLTEEDISLVGSTFEGKLYITARIESGGAGPGSLAGAHARNPVAVGSTRVDLAIGSPSGAAAKPGPARPADAQALRVGLLWSGSTPFDGWSVPEGLRQAFRELGYVDGENVAFEARYAEGAYDRLPEFAAGLVGLKVDVILAAGDSAAIQAAKTATGQTPIVMMALADTVQLGLVKSLSRPGENLTGLSFPLGAIVGKQLELLRKAIPAATRVAVLWNPGNPGHRAVLDEVAAAAQVLKVELQRVQIRAPDDFEDAFAAMKKARADAAVVVWDPMLYAHGGRLTRLALQHRVPTISTYREFAEAAGLMTYGPRLGDIFRGGASYVDKIARGARPADLPVERPTRFELVVNLATAKALGLTLPPSVLVRADRVIR